MILSSVVLALLRHLTASRLRRSSMFQVRFAYGDRRTASSQISDPAGFCAFWRGDGHCIRLRFPCTSLVQLQQSTWAGFDVQSRQRSC
ncbi:hypothetical protein OBBRIDRAFT_93605 [Obba rivulosa]|uniref:Secreted protein n=1 Tax=Obba rivulosa TaxID=1052685 RepID=A0A8E2APK3_9APHY|nr:hypothetical protein OBBRIDRAFT_93605 [Obba rivulosa]